MFGLKSAGYQGHLYPWESLTRGLQAVVGLLLPSLLLACLHEREDTKFFGLQTK